MSRWILDQEAERLEIPNDSDHGWVEIKKRLSVGDQDLLKDRLFQMEQVDTDTQGNGHRRTSKNPGFRTRFRPSTVALLAIAILDWSFLDTSGQKIPVTEINISRMDPWLAGWLEERIGERNPLEGPKPQIREPLPTKAFSGAGS